MTGEPRYHFDRNFWKEQPDYRGIRLHQIGERSCLPGQVIPEHRQWCHEISLITSGQGIFFVDQNTFPVSAGLIVLCPLNSRHSIQVAEDQPLRFSYLGLNFDPEAVASLVMDERDLLRQSEQLFLNPSRLFLRDRGGAAHCFARILAEFYKPSFGSATMIRSQMLTLLLSLLRISAPEVRQAGVLNLPQPVGQPEVVHQIVTCIQQNAASLTRVAQIAAELGYSTSYLSHLFRARTGQTIQSFLLEQRIAAAIEQIGLGRRNVGEIALELGFGTVPSFSRSFRQVTGLSPSQFIRQFQQE